MLVNSRERWNAVHRKSCSKEIIPTLSFCGSFLMGKIVFKTPFPSFSCLRVGKRELAEMEISVLMVLVIALKADVFYLWLELR